MSSYQKNAGARIAKCMGDIKHSLRMAALGNPYAAEPEAERRKDRVQSKAQMTPSQARAFDRTVRGTSATQAEILKAGATAEVTPDAVISGAAAEKVRGTVDFVNVAFLALGARVARSVGRVTNSRNGQGEGSGVLIGANLFMTNNHVIQTASKASNYLLEFDYERDEAGALRRETRYRIDPSIFVNSPEADLDFTIFAVGRKRSGPASLPDFGISPLSDASDKHMLGEVANIVQHPQGRLKEVVLRENRLVSRFDDFLHYVADTEPGSSGSPVYNTEWEMIALHHYGEPFGASADPTLPVASEVNEGIRISSIVRYLRENMASFPPDAQARLTQALQRGGAESRSTQGASRDRPESGGAEVRVDENGTATWTIPIEISVRLPTALAAPVTNVAVDTPPAPQTDDVEDPTARILAAEPTSSSGKIAAMLADDGDDLTQVKGIGPKTARHLQEAGITSFQQIAAWSAAEAEEHAERAGFPGRAQRDDWVGQAKRLMSGQ